MEQEIFIKKDLSTIELKFGLVYPNLYKVGMSSYALRLLYYMINSQENMACERFFLPDYVRYPYSSVSKILDPLRSLENHILLKNFDILGFSIQFENDFRNILWILENASLLKNRKEASENLMNARGGPLIIGGGPVITSNPLPFADFFDVFFIGDAEPILLPFLGNYLKYIQREINYKEFLEKVSNIEGIYVPELDNPVRRSILQNLNESPIPTFQLRTLVTEKKTSKGTFEENHFIEINRGCPFQCKFCLSSFHNSPFRNKSLERIKFEVDTYKEEDQFDTVSFIGSCVSAHPRFKEICKYILDNNLRFTLPSIRIEHVNSEILLLMEKPGIKTITIAPEAGSYDLRQYLGKNISNEMIMDKIQKIKKSKIKNIKFYFLIGLPNERDSDMEAIINLLYEIDKFGFEKKALRINVNPFIPKLNTPFEFETEHLLTENLTRLRISFKTLEKALYKKKSMKLNFKNIPSILNNARLQAIISLGDSQIARLLSYYYQHGANFGALRRAEKKLNISIDDYLMKVKNGYKPWNLLR